MDQRQASLHLRHGIKIVLFDASALERRYLVEHPGGGRFQVSARLADVIQVLNEENPPAMACAKLSAAWGQTVTQDDLAAITEHYLRPHGLLVDENETGRVAVPHTPLLVRLPLFSPRVLAPLIRVGQHFFNLSIAALILLASLGIRYLVYLHAPWSAVNSLDGNILWLPTLVLLGILCHELGHVSACRRYRCTHGPIGIGIYAIFPVFYTDVSDTWRLSRWQRMVVDAGGIYFQLAYSALLYGVYAFWGWQPALVALIITDGMMLLALNPILRFDGYWLFSDLIGVPNLRQRAYDTIGFAVRRLIGRGAVQRPELLRLPVTEMVLLTVYAFVSNGLLLYVFGSLLFCYAPDMVARYPELLSKSWVLLSTGVSQGDVARVVSAFTQPLMTTFVLVTLVLMIWRGRRMLAQLFTTYMRWIAKRKYSANLE